MDDMEPVDDCITVPPWGALGRLLVVGSVTGASRVLMYLFNRTVVHNYDTFLRCLDRPAGQPLITVANHTSTLDDPVLISALLPWNWCLREPFHGGVRWAFCAKEICFKNELLRNFFLTGKTLPVLRNGGGVHQPIMSVASDRLQDGNWLHVFPEGGISFSGRLRPMRQGIGKVVCDTVNRGKDPIVLPIFHSNMGSVMPKLEKGKGIGIALPSIGHTVTVTVGQPMDLSDLTCGCADPSASSREATWKKIAARVGQELHSMAEGAPRNPDQEAPDIHAVSA